MSTLADGVEVDFGAIDAEVARGKGDAAGKPAKTAAEPEITVETAPAAPDRPILTPEAGVKKLKDDLERANARARAAEARADDAARAEAEARGTTQKTQLEQITGAIAQATQNGDLLEAEYATAAAAGDWGAAAKVQRKMADNAADIRDLSRGKTALEKAPPPQIRAPQDPVEAYIASVRGMGAESKTWLRAHPEFAGTPQGRDMLVAAHQLAIGRGFKENTADYFRSVEKTLEIAPSESPTGRTNGNGHAAPEDAGTDTEDAMADAAATPVAPARKAPPAAPVTRSGGAQRGNNVRLSPEQVEAAHASFPNSKTPLEDYARELLALRKEGSLQ